MRIGKYLVRSPFVKFVDIPIEEELMGAIKKSVGASVVADIISYDLCDYDCEVIAYLEKITK